MATEKEKMIAERFYIATDPQLTAERTAARKLCDEFNRTTGDVRYCCKFYIQKVFLHIQKRDSQAQTCPQAEHSELLLTA